MKARTQASLGLLLIALCAGLLLYWWEQPPPARPSPRATQPSGHAAPSEARQAPSEVAIPPETEAGAAAWPANAPLQLFGQVTSAKGDVLPGVTVRAIPRRRRGQALQVRTDATGRYRLDRVPPRLEALEFSARGYETERVDRPHLPAAPKVRWDAVLEPAFGIHGLVLDPDDEPAVGAKVIAFARSGRGHPLAAATTDGSGRFSMRAEGDGPFMVRARHGQHGDAEREDVPASAEITIRLPGGGFVEGRAQQPSGDPIQSFLVSASPFTQDMGGPAAQSFDTADGAFRLGPIAPGRHRLWAVAEGFQPAETRVRVVGGETTEGVLLILKPSAVITGRVTSTRNGGPIEGAQIIPAEWSSGALAETVSAITDDDGRYVLRAIPGERTSVQVSAEGYRSILVGGIEGRPGERVRRDFQLTPQAIDEPPSSELTGIGAVLTLRRGGLLVANVIREGPAADTLAAGDVIVQVDGRPVGRNMYQAVQAIRGDVDTEVVLWVRRGGEGDVERVVLNRKRVVMPERGHGQSPHGRRAPGEQ